MSQLHTNGNEEKCKIIFERNLNPYSKTPGGYFQENVHLNDQSFKNYNST
jgi:hypothetical protein